MEATQALKAPRDESWWKLRNVQIDTFSKMFAMVGVLGAVFIASITYLNYLAQQNERNRGLSVVDLHFDTSVTDISATQSVVLVNIDLANKGKLPLLPYAHTDDPPGEQSYSGEGLTLSVTRHEVPAGDAPIPEDGKRVVSRYNLLEKKYSYSTDRKWDKVYVVEPNVTNRETEAVILQRGALYEFRVRFYAFRRNDDGTKSTWTKTETKYLYLK